MTDLKTTVSGLVAGACQLAGFVFPGVHVVCEPLSALALIAFGWFAKDKR